MRNKVLTTIGLLLCILLLRHGQAVAQGSMDPLNSQELSQIASLLPLPTAQSRQATAQTQTRTQQLLIERQPTEKDQPDARRAAIFTYDYSTDETIIQQVDLASNRLLSTIRQKNTQLPLVETEIEYLKSIIFTDSEQMQLIENEYQRITGQTLTSPQLLNIRAFIFIADSLPTRLNAASRQCGVNRCAQVLLYTHESTVFEISPIVNLSAGIITQNIGF